MEDSKKDDADNFVTTDKPSAGSRSDVGDIKAGEHGQFVRDALKQSEDQPDPTVNDSLRYHNYYSY